MTIQKYEVTAVSARINSGVLELTKEQAGPRMHNLKPIKGNKYEVLNTVEFKRGEVFGFDGDLPKVLASALEPEWVLASELEPESAKTGSKTAAKTGSADDAPDADGDAGKTDDESGAQE